jgi:RHS repeat-associated protein
VTSGNQVQETNTYDGFDNLVSHGQANASGGLDTTSYTYDPMGRLTSQTTSAGATTQYSYLGLSGDLVTETGPAGQPPKSYDYTPGGMRISQTTTSADGTPATGYYTYDAHSDVEAVTGSSGKTTETYGYTAYGDPVAKMFTGADKNTTSPSSTAQPDNVYRFNAMRWDSSSGQYDMGFRNYDPGLNQFVSRDMYDGALNDMNLAADPFTGSAYAFGNGNPISNVELDGHMPCDDNVCGSFQYLEQRASAQEACAKSAQCTLNNQLNNFNQDLSATQSSYKSEQSCINDVLLAFWDGTGYQQYNCGFLGHAQYNSKTGLLVWTAVKDSTGTTQVACDWYGGCDVLGAVALTVGSATIGVLSASGPADEPMKLFSSSGAISNAEAQAQGTALPRTMETVNNVAGKAGVDLTGVQVDLLEGADDIRYLDFMGACASTCPGIIGLGPASFTSEEMLAATLAHERVHIDQNIEGRVGTGNVQALEDEATAAEAGALASLEAANAEAAIAEGLSADP